MWRNFLFPDFIRFCVSQITQDCSFTFDRTTDIKPCCYSTIKWPHASHKNPTRKESQKQTMECFGRRLFAVKKEHFHDDIHLKPNIKSNTSLQNHYPLSFSFYPLRCLYDRRYFDFIYFFLQRGSLEEGSSREWSL